MAHKAFVQQIAKHVLRTTAKVGTKTIGKQKCCTRRYGTGKNRICMLGETDGGKFRLWGIILLQFLTPVVIGGVIQTCIMQVILDRLATLLQVQL